jgi:hypothetical protein
LIKIKEDWSLLAKECEPIANDLFSVKKYYDTFNDSKNYIKDTVFGYINEL